MKLPSDTISTKMRHDPEAGLTVHPDAIENGDTHNDLSDMQRLGKKQEFKVNTPSTPFLERKS